MRRLLGRLKRLRQVGQICFFPPLSPVGFSSSLASSDGLCLDDLDAGGLETGKVIIAGTTGSGCGPERWPWGLWMLAAAVGGTDTRNSELLEVWPRCDEHLRGVWGRWRRWLKKSNRFDPKDIPLDTCGGCIRFLASKDGLDNDQDHQVGWAVKITYLETIHEC